MIRLLLCSILAGASGCLSFCHPISTCWKENGPPLPRCCQSHVYIFFITGLDPLDCANLNGVAEYCHSLGYNGTYVGQLWHGQRFEEEIHCLYHDDPDARFVLVGFSLGANSVRAVAQHLHEDGDIPVELMVYLGGNTIEDTADARPPNVKKLIHILAAGCIWNGSWLNEAENHHVGDVWHFGSPTHDLTLGRLACELADITTGIPFYKMAPPAEELPVSPRPLTPPPAAPPDEWDFLLPAVQLEPLPQQ
jgi:hypothetical protein